MGGERYRATGELLDALGVDWSTLEEDGQGGYFVPLEIAERINEAIPAGEQVSLSVARARLKSKE